jgi:hypothetical protein
VLQPAFDERPIRVLTFDDREVMYDSWWPHKSAWGFTSLKGRVSYYRIPRRFLLERSSYIRTDPLSGAELGFHRPDLPLRFGTSADIEWPAVGDLETFIGSLLSSSPSPPHLPVTKLYLSRPFRFRERTF